jgi:excisionase family DNA binding protein
MTPLVDVDVLAALLRVSTTTIYKLAAEGTIPSIRVGGKSLRFDPDDVLAALKVSA